MVTEGFWANLFFVANFAESHMISYMLLLLVMHMDTKANYLIHVVHCMCGKY